MAAWIPILKAALPYVTDIVTAAIPAFTLNRNNKAASDIVDQQIIELQQSVTHNAESVKTLAEQLQKTILAVDNGASALEQNSEQIKTTLANHSQMVERMEASVLQTQQQLIQTRRWAIVSTVVAVLAVVIALVK